LNPKKNVRVKEEDVRKKFYHAFKGDGENANRNAFNRAKAQAIKNDLIKVERNLMWLVQTGRPIKCPVRPVPV
jgi:hypothetical protein